MGGQGEEGTEDGQKGSRCPPRAAGPGEGAATPEAAESWAVVETPSHCRPAPNGAENKFWNLLSRLPPDSSSCLSLAKPNWKPEIKREVSLRVSFLGLSLGVGLLGPRKRTELVAWRTAGCMKTERKLSWPLSIRA